MWTGRRDRARLVSPDSVYVYKWKEKGFAQFRMFQDRRADNLVYVSVADLNGNGKAEIYVSNTGGPMSPLSCSNGTARISSRLPRRSPGFSG